MMWGHLQKLTRQLLACGVILAMSPGILRAAPPSDHVEGYSEFRETGEYPRTLSLSGNNGARVVIPTPMSNQAPHWPFFYPTFAVSSEKTGELTTAVLTLGGNGRHPFSSSLYAPAGYQWRLRDGDLTPIYGHIYRSQVSPNHTVTLTRVTEHIGNELRPQSATRVIAMNSVEPTLFWERDPDDSQSAEFDWIEIEIDAKEVATVELKPGRSSTVIKAPDRKAMTLTVAAGDSLSARGRSYKVLNVVKPQDIPRVGRLVGWIEISADPVAE